MFNTISHRVTRLEQSNPRLLGNAEIVVESYLFDPARPELGSFERHYQHGAVVYDSFAELLDIVNGRTRSL